MPAPKQPWTKNEEIDLELLYEAGATYTKIAEALNKKYGRNLTRCGVAGKINRMALARTEHLNHINRKKCGRRGEKHTNAKLSDSAVSDIKRRAASGEKQIAIAAEYGVSVSTVCNVIHGRTWRAK